MKHAIKTLVLTALLVGRAAVAETVEPEHLAHFKQKLQLSPEQTEQVKKILDEAEPQRKALREQMKALRIQVKEKIKTVLNKEQQEKFSAMEADREERKARRSARGWADK
ncbi:MAG: hypothetical protein PHT19_11675 [Methylococcus sp.]|nr:hypothetical protein [Methylococcus sp.]